LESANSAKANNKILSTRRLLKKSFSLSGVKGTIANIAPAMFSKIYRAVKLASEKRKPLLRQNGETYPTTETSFLKKCVDTP